MKKYEITWYENGIKHSRIIEARNRGVALEIAWGFAEDVYICEVAD